MFRIRTLSAAALVALMAGLGLAAPAGADSAVPPPKEENRTLIEAQLTRDVVDSICGEDPGPVKPQNVNSATVFYPNAVDPYVYDPVGSWARQNPGAPTPLLLEFQMDFGGELRWVEGMHLTSGLGVRLQEVNVCTAYVSISSDGQLVVNFEDGDGLRALNWTTCSQLYKGFAGMLSIPGGRHGCPSSVGSKRSAVFGVSYAPETDRFILRARDRKSVV